MIFGLRSNIVGIGWKVHGYREGEVTHILKIKANPDFFVSGFTDYPPNIRQRDSNTGGTSPTTQSLQTELAHFWFILKNYSNLFRKFSRILNL